MDTLIPVWIIGGPFIALLVLSFAFRGPSTMGSSAQRIPHRYRDDSLDPSAPLLDPVHPSAPRREV